MTTNLVPFGQRGDRLYTVQEVARGGDCGCLCPNPQCGRPLLARHGDVNVWHFAHQGAYGGLPLGSCGESGLHKYAKQVLSESTGKVVHLPHRTNSEFYSGYEGMIKVLQGQLEVPIPGTTRRCDVLLDGLARPKKARTRWRAHTRIAVEITVSNYKDGAYLDEIRRSAEVSVLEVPLSWAQVCREAERLQLQYDQVVRHILLNQGNNKRWLFKRGGEAWVCSSCGGFKNQRHLSKCYTCLRAEGRAA